MGVSYSYQCTQVTNVKTLFCQAIKPGVKLVQASLHFVNEHGHKLAVADNVVLKLTKYGAEIANDPENFMPEDAPDEEYEKMLKLCENGDPGFDIYNPEEVMAWVEELLIVQPSKKHYE